MPVEPENETPGFVTVERVHTEFEQLLRDRTHMGVRNLIGDTFLEPRNPFQKTKRQPKQWVVGLTAVGVLIVLLVYVFHFR